MNYLPVRTPVHLRDVIPRLWPFDIQDPEGTIYRYSESFSSTAPRILGINQVSNIDTITKTCPTALIGAFSSEPG
jgi:hypothetical protein